MAGQLLKSGGPKKHPSAALAEERRMRLREYMQQTNRFSAADAARHLGIADSTVRDWLAEMVKAGDVCRDMSGCSRGRKAMYWLAR